MYSQKYIITGDTSDFPFTFILLENHKLYLFEQNIIQSISYKKYARQQLFLILNNDLIFNDERMIHCHE